MYRSITRVDIDLEKSLPPIDSFTPLSWTRGFGTDYYGALHVAAAHCGLESVPDLFPGVWQHGCIPPWQQVQPEMTIYCAPRTMPCWVARQDEESYLREAGYTRAKAIGLPIVYTREAGVQRIPGSLLVMPMHSIPGDTRAKDSKEYVAEISRWKRRFKMVAACISARCFENGLWLSHFEAEGIPVLRGAAVDDANSLQRMRTLFETFEYVTTNAYGSHVPYALYLGAKVSLWGPSEPITSEYLKRDALWASFPQAADRFLAQETLNKAEEWQRRFRVEPPSGITDPNLGAWMIGHQNKLSPRQIRKAFHWGSLSHVLMTVGTKARNSWAWKGLEEQ
jgi:hypothetical protein